MRNKFLRVLIFLGSFGGLFYLVKCWYCGCMGRYWLRIYGILDSLEHAKNFHLQTFDDISSKRQNFKVFESLQIRNVGDTICRQRKLFTIDQQMKWSFHFFNWRINSNQFDFFGLARFSACCLFPFLQIGILLLHTNSLV